MKNLFLILFIFLFLSTASGHEGHNREFDDGDTFWGWDQNVKSSYSWDLLVKDGDTIFREGDIDLSTKVELSELNLFSYFQSEEYLQNKSLSDYIDNYIDVTFDEGIQIYESNFLAKYLLAPVILYANNTEYNLLKEDFDFYLGLINETIELTCIQGCHPEQLNPFHTTSSKVERMENEYVISGEFILTDIPENVIYNYDNGTFKAVYQYSGVLSSWTWIGGDNQDVLTLTLKNISNAELNLMIYRVFVPMIVLIIITLSVYKYVLPKLV